MHKRAIKNGFVISEFHFVDLYNSKNGWEEAEKYDKESLFEEFAKSLEEADIIWFIQSLDKESKINFEKSCSNLNFKKLCSYFSFEINYEFFILILLLKQVADFLKSCNVKYTKINIICDEGLCKQGKSINFSHIFESISQEAKCTFSSSSKEYLLQMHMSIGN